MKKKSKTKQALKLLKDAYSIETPEDNVEYYRDFSKVYDDIYVEGMSYVYPKYVAKELISYYQEDGPICDIGCGTGLVGKELIKLNSKLVIDGIDISSDMLKVAGTKSVYRNLYSFDLTKPIKRIPMYYKAIISSGTFTHGHLGPKSLINLLIICDVGCILTIGINGLHYVDKGFKKILDNLEKSSKIKMLNIIQQDIYSQQMDLDNQKNSKALICTFKKCS